MSIKKLTLTLFLLLFSASLGIQSRSMRGLMATKCTERSEFCTRDYNPVCAYKPDIMCITTPCNYVTYSNPCEACKNNDVESYTKGACGNGHPTQVQIVPVEPNDQKVIECSGENRHSDFCTKEYNPVCACKLDIGCKTSACTYVTYGNACEACHDKDVKSYVLGECEEETPYVASIELPQDGPDL